ncbi:hypothetical protein MUN88_08985 [Gracilibacillus caseinilyticus]|uniref:Uncharacterized protein n=1 Tax=Gracilibacillus caseinilyticus TaxID=2932256 RepID=A0ABY4F0H5_9BACI|nr:hypothetical protein [Gracilibacillus caseinilyticus]UOQ50169.1 hypothetical protein MUN88_08985 [Gracilibacillus caseinilyticus]
MNNWLYILYATLLALLSFFTGEIVTFIMLGIILISLQNIHRVLKELLNVNKQKLENDQK